jgi:hypothetical protein
MYLIDDNASCPTFMPMDEDDKVISKTILEAMTRNSDLHLSECIRK